jgi:hypothetical protein
LRQASPPKAAVEAAPRPPGAAATLSVNTNFIAPISPGESVDVGDITIVALTVDEIVAS